MWRYSEVLPKAVPVTLGEGMTPLLHARRLGERLGLERLYIKDEGQNPTGSFKARGLSAAVTMAKALGLETLALPTAGNAGGAAAAYAAEAGLAVRHRDAVATRRRQSSSNAARSAPTCSSSTASSPTAASSSPRRRARHGWFEVSTLKEPYRIEGKKTMGYELWEELEGACRT